MKNKKKLYSKKLITPDENYNRVNNILSADKLPMNEECRKIALNDIKNVLDEYFDTENLTMNISEDGRNFKVKIDFSALRIKSFNVLK